LQICSWDLAYKVEIRKMLFDWGIEIDVIGGELLSDLFDCEVGVLLGGQFGGGLGGFLAEECAHMYV
jgi:hypothetical protein